MDPTKLHPTLQAVPGENAQAREVGGAAGEPPPPMPVLVCFFSAGVPARDVAGAPL